jgi:hypothetical protein
MRCMVDYVPTSTCGHRRTRLACSPTTHDARMACRQDPRDGRPFSLLLRLRTWLPGHCRKAPHDSTSPVPQAGPQDPAAGSEPKRTGAVRARHRFRVFGRPVALPVCQRQSDAVHPYRPTRVRREGSVRQVMRGSVRYRGTPGSGSWEYIVDVGMAAAERCTAAIEGSGSSGGPRRPAPSAAPR